MVHKIKIHPLCIALVLPMTILFFFLHTYPFLSGVFYSLTNWKGYGNWKFVGFNNYIQLFKDSNIIKSYLFTFKFAVCATLLVNILSLAIACGLNNVVICRNFLKAVFFMPYMLGTLIVSYVFRFFFSNLLPLLGNFLGIEALKVNILGTSYAWIGVLIVTIWQSLAFNILIYISGLQTIDNEIYEAAEIDGAKGIIRFIKITFPMLAPFFTINMVLCGKNFLMIFDQIIALTNGGPGNATTSISVLIFKRGFQGQQFAYQSANSVILFLVVVLISIFQLRVLEKREAKYE